MLALRFVLREDRDGLAKAQEMTCTARSILLNSWFSLRANKRLCQETEGLPLQAGRSYEIHRTEGQGPDMQARIAGFMNKTAKLQ